jgi:hypothetical protein
MGKSAVDNQATPPHRALQLAATYFHYKSHEVPVVQLAKY